MTASAMSTPRRVSSWRKSRPFSSVPVAPMYFVFRQTRAQVESAVAICPPRQMVCSRIRIFAKVPCCCG
jgi:hypothetical protein